MKILIQHGHVIDPAHQIDRVADVAIAAGKIVAVGSIPPDFSPNRVIEAQGLVVAPGLVDLSARLREPGYEYKATLETEMRAAMHGGVTSLSCPPDTDPVLDEPGLVEMLKFRAQSLNQAHVYPQGALTLGLKGDTLTEMNELTEAGCIGFGQADAPMVNTQAVGCQRQCRNGSAAYYFRADARDGLPGAFMSPVERRRYRTGASGQT
jgi:dihydroorotase